MCNKSEPKGLFLVPENEWKREVSSFLLIVAFIVIVVAAAAINIRGERHVFYDVVAPFPLQLLKTNL